MSGRRKCLSVSGVWMGLIHDKLKTGWGGEGSDKSLIRITAIGSMGRAYKL
jgi:hypothetical protein